MQRTISPFVIAAVLGIGAVALILAQPSGIPAQAPDAAGGEAINPDKFDQETLEFPFRTRLRPSIFRPVVQEAARTPEDEARIEDNCLWGLPKIQQGAAVGPTQLVVREGYVLEHSYEGRIPLWVSEHATKAELSGSLPRTNPFKPDPKLSGFPRAELSDYRGSGFDRGHMAPNGNQTVDDRVRRETFFLSNIVPQVGKKFNQSIWADLEGEVRKWTRKRGDSWIVTGVLFHEADEENPATADGMVEIEVIGDNEVQVPTHLFKIVVAKNTSGEWESIALVMSNANHGDNEKFDQHIQTIDWIEERAGFNFFPEVSAETGNPGLEAKLESTKSPLWN